VSRVNPDPSAPFDRLVRDALERSASPPDNACLDAETLAAWEDQTVGRDEKRAIEAHVARCARCQALLASLAKTGDTEISPSWWRSPSIRWLVPLAVAAASLAIWISIPERPTVRVAQAPPEAADRLTYAQAPAAQKGAGAPQASPSEHERDDRSLDRLQAQEELRAKQRQTGRLDLDDKVAKKPSPPPSTAAADSFRANETVTAETRAEPAAEAGARSFAKSAGVGGVIAPIIVSSNPASRWRIAAGGVQHSADGGATWRTEEVGPGASLTSGYSPSPSVCWLIGRAGNVFLSTDGRTWRRLPFPETVDLISVAAADDKSATVTAADGRTFRTTDGGETWTSPGE
jgi:hypothetical protein